jgi:hypothetical protein
MRALNARMKYEKIPSKHAKQTRHELIRTLSVRVRRVIVPLMQGKEIAACDLGLAQPTASHMALYMLYRNLIILFVIFFSRFFIYSLNFYQCCRSAILCLFELGSGNQNKFFFRIPDPKPIFLRA